MIQSNTENVSSHLSEIPFGLFASILCPFALLLAFFVTVDGGLLHATHADLAWAVATSRQVPDKELPEVDDSTVITIDRSMCFGWCPIYSLKLFGSGKVEYRGRGFVCAYGSHSAVVDSRDVRRLVHAMLASGYFGFTWREGGYATDMASVETSLQHGGRRYDIHHYLGDDGAPKWLRAMEEEIDRVAGTERWLPIWNDKFGMQCPTRDGGTRNAMSDSPFAELIRIEEPKIEAPKIVPPEPPVLEQRWPE